MALSDLEVFSEEVYGTSRELLDYNIDAFNKASNGGLVLVPGSLQGDFKTEAMWGRIANLVRRRDAYGSGALSQVELSMKSMTKVKVAAGTNPVNLEKNMLSWIKKDPAEAAALVAQQIAEDDLAARVALAIKLHIATVGAQSALVNDKNTVAASLANLLETAGKLGDRADNIRCWIIHSVPMFQIWGSNLTNSQNLFQFGNVKIKEDGFGRPLIMTDNSNLNYASGKYYTLGLQAGAVVIEDNGDYNGNTDVRNGNENIATTYQAEWTYNAGVKGFSYNTVDGGASPSDAALATSTNWTKTLTSNKDLGGVLLKTGTP
jgi:hypothetical protein